MNVNESWHDDAPTDTTLMIQKNGLFKFILCHSLGKVLNFNTILIKLAIHHGILDSYKQFLHAHNLQGFIPTDLEAVD